MYTTIYNTAAKARLAYEEYKNPMALVKRLERGDADSSGSTLRTAGVVALVVVVFAVIGLAVFNLANVTDDSITTPTW